MGATDTKKSLIVRQSKDTEMFTNELTDTQAIKLLKDAVKQRKQAERPNLPEYAITTPKYEDRTANGLSRCIIDFINSQDFCHAERISNEGVMRKDTNGRAFRANSSMTNGTADISATIHGRSVKIEIKIGNDRQSEAQKNYQNSIENALGYYLIVKDFDSFLSWFMGKMETIKAKKGGESGK